MSSQTLSTMISSRTVRLDESNADLPLETILCHFSTMRPCFSTVDSLPAHLPYTPELGLNLTGTTQCPTTVWTCCRCGNHNGVVAPQCLECPHERCTDCKTETVKDCSDQGCPDSTQLDMNSVRMIEAGDKHR
ncbi:hypothetical protein BT63DRAFT_461442 [Microthyrium microscopicum]|uniref:RanBP2-type domain-containing protein n=1 Tax=Microthyrium microscopicum TaxID=703497 RepID=A0A6A6TWK1_9PEZI|nr:hypothetical protein BT63DRAFT_461442 [Microthyrium microscopicum]